MTENVTEPKPNRRLRTAALVALMATLLTAFAGVVMYLAGSVLLDLAPPSSVPGSPVSDGLLSQGPLGYAALMALLMACGSPVVGLGVFAMLFFGRPHAD
jgi:hypothetical protein